jgi:hypothetical protein
MPFGSMDCRVKPGNDEIGHQQTVRSEPSPTPDATIVPGSAFVRLSIHGANKKGGGAPIDVTVSLPRQPEARVTTRAWLGEWARIRARTPTGAPPRLLHRRTNATAQPQAALPGTRLKDGCYPSPPVPVQRASRRPVIMPAGRLPRAARERFARPPAGTALAPLSGSHLESALVERDGGAISRDGDEGQEQSTNLIVQLSKPLNSNLFGVKHLT